MAQAKGAWGEIYEVPDVVETTVEETTEQPIQEQVQAEIVNEPIVEEAKADLSTETTETVISDTTPVEVIKEVEKIVEKYPEMDEYTSEIFQALLNKEEEKVLGYLTEKHRNYKTMSDYDVVREHIQKTNPEWNSEDVDLEMRVKYGNQLSRIDINAIDKDENPDEYDAAIRNNEQFEKNEILLKRDSRDARIALEKAKKEINFPKIEKAVEAQSQQPTAEQIAQGRALWEQSVDAEMPNLKDFDFKVGDKENGFDDVPFEITDKDRQSMTDFMKNLDSNTIALELGWVNKDGKQDISRIAGDVLKLKNISKIVSSAYTKGKTAGAKGTIAEIKNIDLSKQSTQATPSEQPDIGQQVWGHLLNYK